MTDPRAVQWFRRTTGKWTSERRYLFAPKMKPTNMTTEFTIGLGERSNIFVVEWTGRTEGQMILTLEGDTLSRSRDYFGEGAHPSKISMLDDDAIVMRTEYDGLKFREEIRMLQADTIRLRQTVGVDAETGQTKIVGQYFEERTL